MVFQKNETCVIAQDTVSLMRWTYYRAGHAMLVTTVTTAGSFYSLYLSEVLVVKNFGFFMGTLVVVNFVNTMTIFASAVVMREHVLNWTALYVCSRCPERCRDLCCPKLLVGSLVDDAAEREADQPSEVKQRQELCVEIKSAHRLPWRKERSESGDLQPPAPYDRFHKYSLYEIIKRATLLFHLTVFFDVYYQIKY